jgi:hypothetical protein
MLRGAGGKQQAASSKQRAASSKQQAASSKQQAASSEQASEVAEALCAAPVLPRRQPKVSFTSFVESGAPCQKNLQPSTLAATRAKSSTA